MPKTRPLLLCSACGRHVAQWVGRCPGCGGWGTIPELDVAGSRAVELDVQQLFQPDDRSSSRLRTGLPGLDRVLGGGVVPASVSLLAGEPGIGKSTLLLQMTAGLSATGAGCLLASGEESRAQVAARARRIGVPGGVARFVGGRDLNVVLAAARRERPAVLAIDSIQTIRDPDALQAPGGAAQVRACADRLVGLAKEEGMAVVMAGHVTKDGDVAGPRALEHAVDVVLTFDGDARSGLRTVAAGKNRFGPEGEVAWFEMHAGGLAEIDPASILRSDDGEPGAATALPLAGRRAFAAEVQALVVPGDGPARRQATGLDLRRLQLVAAVLDRAGGFKLSRAELFGASLGGVRLDDPACDLAIAAALASAATGRVVPHDSAFVGEVGLTGLVRPAPGMSQRLTAARSAGCRRVFAALESDRHEGVQIVPIRHVRDALTWSTSGRRTRSAAASDPLS